MGKCHRIIKTYIVQYTLFWMAAALFIYCLLKVQGRNLLWYPDGAYQHFPAFNYICDITEAILHGNRKLSEILPFQYSIGQGVDLFTTLNSYDISDPISWLASGILFMTRVQRYTVMVFVKLWLTGAAYSLYCYIIGHKDKLAILCGSLAYTFSGTILFMFTRHPNYINWGYFLPLFLGGYELYRREKKRGLLIAATFLNLVVSFYTLYINAILLALYVLTRSAAVVWEDRTQKTMIEELLLDIRAAGVCAIGALLGAFSLLPTIYAYIQNPRVAEATGYMDSKILYDATFYKDLFVVLFAPYIRADHTTVVGFLGVNLIAILYYYKAKSRDSRNRALKIYGIVMLLMLGSPLSGKILNGMGYPSNRWDYAIAFAAALIMTETFREIQQCTQEERIRIVNTGIIYVLACFLLYETLPGVNKTAAMAMLLVMLYAFRHLNRVKSANRAIVLTVMTSICVVFQILFFYAPQAGDYASQFERMDNYAEHHTDSAKLVAGLSTEEDFFRTESQETTVNIDGITGVNGTNAWWSLLPESMIHYLNDFELNSIIQNCYFEGLDGRTALLEMAGVRYYTTLTSDLSSAPYGYAFREDLSDDSFKVYENEYTLPICYTFPHYITRKAYDELNAIQKQEAILQGAILDESDIAALPAGIEEAAVESGAYELDYEIQDHEGIVLTDHRILTEEAGNQIVMLADIPENAEPDYYFRRGTAPQVNVIESDRKFKIEIAAPGMSKDDLKIELTADGQLMVSLEKSEEHDDKEPKNCDKEGKSCDKEECCHYLRREFSCSAFRQFFTIPESVDKERITAKMRHGILCIKLPKRDGADKASAARQIAIE